jgi:hypothetical protein
MSVLLYPGGEDQEQAVYVPVEPADPFTEAIRTALEIGAEYLFADPGIGRAPAPAGPLSDTYSIRAHRNRKVRGSVSRLPAASSDEIARIAAGIAWKLQGPIREARVFCVISLNLLDPGAGRDGRAAAEPADGAEAACVESLQSSPGLSGRDDARISILQETLSSAREAMDRERSTAATRS